MYKYELIIETGDISYETYKKTTHANQRLPRLMFFQNIGLAMVAKELGISLTDFYMSLVGSMKSEQEEINSSLPAIEQIEQAKESKTTSCCGGGEVR